MAQREGEAGLILICSGSIKTGDPITSSSIPGVGMKAARTGKIIGYAMQNEDLADGEEVKEILVFVNVGYYVSGEDYAKLNKIDRLEREIEALRERQKNIESKL